MKRLFLLFLASFALAAVTAANAASRASEVSSLLEAIEQDYAYLSLTPGQLQGLRQKYVARAGAELSDQQYVRLLEEIADEFHDNHLHLNTNLSDSYRLVPSQTVLLAEWSRGLVVVRALRPSAGVAGIQMGDIIETIDGVAVREAVEKHLASHADNQTEAARVWALNQMIAGRRDKTTVLGIRSRGRTEVAQVTLPRPPADSNTKPPVSTCRAGGVLYLRLNDSLGSEATIAAFSEALAGMAGDKELVIDLRDTPSGGNSLVARSILGHFVEESRPYQMHELPGDFRQYGISRRWLELVGPFPPLLHVTPTVLVGPWTGSMGEGLAIGFDATAAGTVVGTRMAGLRGATSCISIPSLGGNACLNLPTQRLFHVNGTPREQFVPPPIPAKTLEQIAGCAR